MFDLRAVIPAQAGIQLFKFSWVSAFTGMTETPYARPSMDRQKTVSGRRTPGGRAA